MKKILLVSGCSFTFEKWCWPGHLSDTLNYDLLNVGMASQGNGLISRKVIYNVEQLLKQYKSEDILVGIMWSGVDRYDYYSESSDDVKSWGSFDKDCFMIKNPTNIVNDRYNWRIINHFWKNIESKLYYENFHTEIFSMIMTIEHILRIQSYLNTLNINYFMTTFMNIFEYIYTEYKYEYPIIEHPEIKYLYDLIDFNKFLPIEGCYEWVKKNYPIEGFNPPKNGYIDDHPTEFAYKKFSDEIIIPYLKNNNMYD